MMKNRNRDLPDSEYLVVRGRQKLLILPSSIYPIHDGFFEKKLSTLSPYCEKMREGYKKSI
jgi:hypothetical protein